MNYDAPELIEDPALLQLLVRVLVELSDVLSGASEGRAASLTTPERARARSLPRLVQRFPGAGQAEQLQILAALAEIGDPRAGAESLLLELLESPDPVMLRAAGRAPARLGTRRAAESLARRLTRHPALEPKSSAVLREARLRILERVECQAPGALSLIGDSSAAGQLSLSERSAGRWSPVGPDHTFP